MHLLLDAPAINKTNKPPEVRVLIGYLNLLSLFEILMVYFKKANS